MKDSITDGAWSLGLVLSFASGVGVSIVGAVFATYFQKRREQRDRIEGARFEVYMALLDLHGLYFFITADEVHKTEPRLELLERIRRQAWRIADRLRSTDEMDELEDVIDVLFSAEFSSASDRYDATTRLIDGMASRVNPRYVRRVRKLGEASLAKMQQSIFTKPPVSF
jgi:hypothetical protein